MAIAPVERRVRRAEPDQGLPPDLPTSVERDEIRKLWRENFELSRAKEILKSAPSASHHASGIQSARSSLTSEV
jgi:transposase